MQHRVTNLELPGLDTALTAVSEPLTVLLTPLLTPAPGLPSLHSNLAGADSSLEGQNKHTTLKLSLENCIFMKLYVLLFWPGLS